MLLCSCSQGAAARPRSTHELCNGPLPAAAAGYYRLVRGCVSSREEALELHKDNFCMRAWRKSA